MTRTDRNHADVVLHLQMIQRVIERMADNAFKAKQWALLTMAATFTVFELLDPSIPIEDVDSVVKLSLALFCVWLGFYLIDTYFLYLERQYRAKFNAVRQQDETDFDMTYEHSWQRFFGALYSIPNLGFYCLLILIYIFAFQMYAVFGSAK